MVYMGRPRGGKWAEGGWMRKVRVVEGVGPGLGVCDLGSEGIYPLVYAMYPMRMGNIDR